MMERNFDVYSYLCDSCGEEVESSLPKRFSNSECTECEGKDMYQLIELTKGKTIVLDSGSFIKMLTLKKALVTKIHGALIIKPIKEIKKNV